MKKLLLIFVPFGVCATVLFLAPWQNTKIDTPGGARNEESFKNDSTSEIFAEKSESPLFGEGRQSGIQLSGSQTVPDRSDFSTFSADHNSVTLAPLTKPSTQTSGEQKTVPQGGALFRSAPQASLQRDRLASPELAQNSIQGNIAIEEDVEEILVPEGTSVPAVLANGSTNPLGGSNGQKAPFSSAAEGVAEGIVNEFFDTVETAPVGTADDERLAWRAAAARADERYRALYGHDAFLRYSIQAAKEALKAGISGVR